jgi:hypothetical protein
MVKISDSQVRELRQRYWDLPSGQRPSTVSLAAQLRTDSKTVWNWLHGKSRLSAGGPTGESAGSTAQSTRLRLLP